MKIAFNMRFRKEIQIFKEVYQHSLFGDHVQEVRTAPFMAMSRYIMCQAAPCMAYMYQCCHKLVMGCDLDRAHMMPV